MCQRALAEQGGGIDQVVDGLDQKLVMRGGVNGLVEVVVRFDRVRAILAVLQYGAHIVDFDVVGMLDGKAGRAAFKYRSEERSVGKECVSTCSSGWSL